MNCIGVLKNKEYRQVLFDKIGCPLIYLSNGHIQEINLVAIRLLNFDVHKDYQVDFLEFCQAHNFSLIDIFEKNYESQGILEETYFIKNESFFIRWKMIEFADLNENLRECLIIGHDFTNEQLILQNMRKTELFYNNILSKLPTYVYWKDKNSIYLGCNDLLAKALGLPSKEAIKGMTDFDFNWGKEGAAESFIAFDRKVMCTGIPLTIEDIFKIADGSFITVLTNKTAMKDEKGEVIGVLAISVDITERKRMENELKEAKIQAEAAYKAKSEFIANMSHDIRTPLSGILTVSENLSKNSNSPENLKDGEDIYNSGLELLELLNSVLDAAKQEHINEADLEFQTFRLNDVIKHVSNLMQPSIKAKAIEIKFEMDPKIPEYVITDQLKLKRILQNLVGNAIKFTHQGHVYLQTQLLSRRKDKVEIRFCVSDTGVGIPKCQQNQVFDQFFRATPSYQGVYHGHGVGLFIVKKFVNLLGGDITVESEEGKGTSFNFTLELKIGKEKEATEVIQELEVPRLEKIKPIPKSAPQQSAVVKKTSEVPRILMVEDNCLISSNIQKTLKGWGYEVEVAEDAETGITLFKNNDFDLVIADLGLPGLQGNEMANLLRYWEKMSDRPPIPILALTAHADDKIKKDCLLAGMDQVYMKPANEQLLKEMLRWMDKKSGASNLAKENAASPLATPESITGLGRDLPATEAELFQLEKYSLFDEKDGIEKCGGKDNLKVGIKMTIEDIVPVELGHIQKVYHDKDWDQVQKIAHKLKGGSMYCGTVRMTEACKYLERYWKAGHRELLEKLYQQMLKTIEETQKNLQDWLKK